MPNNDNQFNNNNNNDFNELELPTLSKAPEMPKPSQETTPNQVQQSTVQNNPKPLIEIPKEYYEKLEQEKEQKMIEEQERQAKEIEVRKAKNDLGKLFTLVVFNAILIFALIHLYLNVNEMLIFAIPVYIIVLSAINAFTDKKNSNQPLANMIGGMVVAVITFLLSMSVKDKMDYWTYFAIVSAIIAFLGLVTSSIVTKIIADIKSIKALESIGMVLYVVALFGIPYFFYNKYPEEFYKTVFLKQTEVHAETEEEFIIKTLKNRYNIKFVCDEKSIKSQVDQNSRKISLRTCYEESFLEERNINLVTASDLEKAKLSEAQVTVTSIAYNEGDNQYIVQDTFMDTLLLNNFRKTLQTNLTNVLNVSNVIVYIYPESNCSFIGNCVDSKEYYENYEKEVNADNQYKNSTELNFEKYLTYDANTFVNEYKFKYIINVYGTINSESYDTIVNKVLDRLNKSGLKNTYGYDIHLYNIASSGERTKVHTATGETNSEQEFKTSGDFIE